MPHPLIELLGREYGIPASMASELVERLTGKSRAPVPVPEAKFRMDRQYELQKLVEQDAETMAMRKRVEQRVNNLGRAAVVNDVEDQIGSISPAFPASGKDPINS